MYYAESLDIAAAHNKFPSSASKVYSQQSVRYI